MCSKTVGKSQSGLIHICMLEKGYEETRVFMSSIQKLVNNWLVTYGHTVGVQDTIAQQSVLEDISKEMIKSKDIIKQKILLAQNELLKVQPGKNMLETFEAKVNRIMN